MSNCRMKKARQQIILRNGLAVIVTALSFLSIGWANIEVAAQPTTEGLQGREGVSLKWLGNAGWEIRAGQTVILIDPFLTRQEAKAGVEWKTDEDSVSKIISKADFIFAGHSHADHVGDVPFIAKKFGSKVIGSRTTTNIALTGGVNKSQLVTISGGEKLDFEGFSVQVIESEHGGTRRSGRTRRPKFEEITKPLAGPLKGGDFVEGGCYLYYFTFGKHRVLHQSTAGFIEENLNGLQPDVLLMAATDRTYDLARVLKTLSPKTIILQHFDEWRAPVSQGLPAGNRRRAQRFANDIRAIDPAIKTLIPDFFAPITLE
jgi:L-ascorbate metabolism protein UlaG (beta-lactamase superfamily)